jgi:hypothetical protein
MGLTYNYTMNEKCIRAVYDNNTITVYQAYNQNIASSAVFNKTFVSPPFKLERMTWIKPSFLWMMYRSGWAAKEDQDRILQIKIKREGFEWALENSCLSKYDKSIYNTINTWKSLLNISPVRIQWDPDRDIFLQCHNYKAIQIGLSDEALRKYISEWIMDIEDVTANCKIIYNLLKDEKINQAKELLPNEIEYPLPEKIANKIGII